MAQFQHHIRIRAKHPFGPFLVLGARLTPPNRVSAPLPGPCGARNSPADVGRGCQSGISILRRKRHRLRDAPGTLFREVAPDECDGTPFAVDLDGASFDHAAVQRDRLHIGRKIVVNRAFHAAMAHAVRTVRILAIAARLPIRPGFLSGDNSGSLIQIRSLSGKIAGRPRLAPRARQQGDLRCPLRVHFQTLGQ